MIEIGLKVPNSQPRYAYIRRSLAKTARRRTSRTFAANSAKLSGCAAGFCRPRS